MTAPHPAKFSKTIRPILDPTRAYWPEGDFTPMLDPLAGVGTSGIGGLIHSELEPEWAAQCPEPRLVADARALPFADGTFGGILTSPVYGNRMSDHQDAKDACKTCDGIVMLKACPTCNGTGLSKRYTYRHFLGRPLHRANTGAMQWGSRYRSYHSAIWEECVRVLRRGGIFVLNVSDHYRGGTLQPVSAWHREELRTLGLRMVEEIRVPTQRQRHGQNGGLRAEYESVFMFLNDGDAEPTDLFSVPAQPAADVKTDLV